MNCDRCRHENYNESWPMIKPIAFPGFRMFPGVPSDNFIGN